MWVTTYLYLHANTRAFIIMIFSNAEQLGSYSQETVSLAQSLKKGVNSLAQSNTNKICLSNSSNAKYAKEDLQLPPFTSQKSS